MLLLAFVVGVIGGTYGIGGGAIIAPFCVAVFRLPVYTVAGAALLGTFLTSILGVIIYSVIPIPAPTESPQPGRRTSPSASCSASAASRACTWERGCRNTCRRSSSSCCWGS